MGTRIDKTSGKNYYEQKLNSAKQKAEKKTLASIMKPKKAATQKASAAAKQLAKENQEFLTWALKNINKKEDLKAIKDLVETYGSADQRKEFNKLSALYSDKKPKTWARYAQKHNTTYTQPVSGVVEAEKQAAKIIEANKQRAEYLKSIGLGDAKPTKTSGMTWAKYAQEHGTTYTQPVSGVVEAEKQAAKVIEANKQKAEYLKSIGLGDAKPTKTSGMTWAKYAQEHGTTYTQPVSGVVEAEKQAAKVIEANKQRAEYLKSIGLGDAKPTKSSGMTWAKYAQEHGTTYTQPVSGVVEAEKQAAKVIEGNKQKVQNVVDNVSAQVTKTTNNLPVNVVDDVTASTVKKINWKSLGKYAVIGCGIAALTYGIYSLFKKDENEKNVNSANKGTSETTSLPQKEVEKTPVQKPVFVKEGGNTTATNDSIKTNNRDTIRITKVKLNEEEIMAAIAKKMEKKNENNENIQTSNSDFYIVKENDNVWRIVKSVLEEELGRKPKKQEIADYVVKVLNKNNLKYEEDNYTVLIYPKDTLDVAS